MTSVIDTLHELSRAFLKLARGQVRLFFLEAKLARYSVVPLLGLLCLLFILGSSVILFTLVLIVYGVYLLCHDLFSSLLIVELIGIILFLIALKFALAFFKQLQFTRTRRYFAARRNKVISAVQEELNGQHNNT